MLTKLIICPDLNLRKEFIDKLLKDHKFPLNHPDLLYLESEDLGVEEVKIIRDHLNFKPLKASGKAVTILQSEKFSTEAQNALLKTLEEPPLSSMLILGSSSEDKLLPTILSRCQTINLSTPISVLDNSDREKIKKLLNLSVEERFVFIEKLENRLEFLNTLTFYFREQMLGDDVVDTEKPIKYLIEAQKMASQNVNPRAILEYLMLKIPLSK